MLLHQSNGTLTDFRGKLVGLAHDCILSRNAASSKPGVIQMCRIVVCESRGGSRVRYGKDHMSETRARIQQIASARYRRDGVGGVVIQRLMADAGLTHGGFYAHFPSKTDHGADAVRAA